MMMKPDDLEALAALDSQEVKDAMEQLALEVLRGTMKMYRMGPPTQRMQIAKTLIPLLVRQMKKDQESEEITALRQQMNDLHNEIIKTSPTRLRVVNGEVEVIEEDAPPG